ncbi:MAG: mechanosensitive ion channel family protein [Alphaproteobacteria bacterium]|nr:mechanosensitive ion channel family protein [Alphaproteobacteria bacterium]
MKKLHLWGIVISVLLSVVVCANTYASVNIIGESLKFSEISAKLTRIATDIKKENVNSQTLVNDIAYLREKRAQLESSKQDLESNIRIIERRVEALGQAPEDGNEVKIIADKRKEFKDELAKERARLSEADLLLARIEEIDMAVFDLRNKELWGNLLQSSDPIIYPSVFFASSKMLFELVIDIIKSPYPWYEKLSQTSKDNVRLNLFPVLLVIIFVGFFGFIVRRFILRNFGYLPSIEHPRFGRKILASVAVWFAYGIIPASIIGALLFWMFKSKFWSGGLYETVMQGVLYYSLCVIVGRATSRVIFTPYNEKWRLINISTNQAKRVTGALYASIFLVGVISFLQHIVTVQNYPIELMTFLVGISAVIKAFCIAWVLHSLMWENSDEEIFDTEESEETDNSANKEVSLTLLSTIVALAILGMSVFGYPYLGAFITDRIIYSIILIMVIGGFRKIIHEVMHRVLFLKFWFKTFRMKRGFLRRIDFWFSFLIDPLLVLSGIFVLFAIWGVPTDTLYNVVYKIFSGFTIGGIKISLLSIILGIVTFFISIAVVKYLRQKLENGLLARTEIEEGTKHSLSAGFASIGYVASGILAIVIMGGNLTNIALVAGALSVGVGLGLQNVVNNFVSGIILLFERPVKVGDWVVINGEEGKVKQINIRSTEIETFRRSSLIIPNADLLSTTVTNLTHGNNWARHTIKVGVAYGSDILKVKEILLECANSHKKVLRKPEPYVLFQDFGSSSLDFELRCYTGDIWNGWTVPSDLRFEINKRFAEEGIEIPFAQIVVHTGSEVSKETQNMFYASNKKKGKKNAD